MAYVVKDRVKVTSTTTGTGTFTLGAAAVGFQDFSVITPNTAWNIANSVYLQSKSTLAQDTSPQGLFFKDDGTKMYFLGSANDSVYEYDLSTAWDVSTATYLQSLSVAAQETTPTDIFFKPDGLKMYIVGSFSNDAVYEYDLSSAWNISTATYLQSFSISAQDLDPTGLFFKPDGLKMYIAGNAGNDINEYNLSSAWDISTASYLQNFSVSGQDTSPQGLFFKDDGTKMYFSGALNNSVFEYYLTSAWNITSAIFAQSFSVSAQANGPVGLFFKPDGLKMYVLSQGTDSVVEYNLTSSNQTYYGITDGTNWEIGLGTSTYGGGGSTLSRSPFESSNSDALVNFSAGTKDVFVTFPSENTLGTVPTADNSSVGTDLVAWLNLKKQLDAGVVNGVPYANNGTNGIVSTYSLVYTTSGAYFGGVLAPNGDIHFISSSANRGQKISSAGVVSTYSLVYTAGSYLGGVLAANGDIHFIPSSAVVGQKISAAGVVSTYSLVYTVANSYAGGVLSPSGEVHFIPRSANRGQKVSVAGVVSTYSLVYTTTLAYTGGVLASNGDIYFVPRAAIVGQKISAAGVVSTYSLVYTASNAYSGGVLAANGDIHFVPSDAIIGQKIDLSGVVSTYSLVYTTTTAYQGGVLAPNGDIHFIPQSANRGQKVSSSGVVSTYSLVYTVASANSGGVLAPNGDIYFIPASATVGQKISTNVQQKVGYALSPFFNKF